ncbi:LamG-like jellyroll fold domain-containing protein [Curtobacterium sp. RIT-PI-V]|uniref:LamG-like jellyroll fold domain-containing protein n=1 Tax=Curtobacterium sp. RIT-PI-V TaxID=3035296 RepID=UPI0021D8124F|nr:LamG-like jellyroll fold domain-containing protein [Curtobacterium sp. RIT-PI-V]
MPNRTETRPCVGDAPRLLLAVAARTVLWSVLLVAVWAALPAAFGWHVTTVVSDSMAPGVRAGDIVAAMPVDAEAVTPGRVLLVDDPDHDDRLRLHRLERIEQDGALRLRGDANAEADRSTVAPTAVHGVGVLRFPGIGLLTVWIRSGAWTSVALTVAVAAVLAALARADRDIVAGQPCRRCGTPRWDLHTRVLTPAGVVRPTQTALPIVAALAATTIVLGTMASAGFSGTTNSASSLRSQTFGCFHDPAAGAVLAWDFADKDDRLVTDSSGTGAGGQFIGDGTRTIGSCADNPHATFGTTGSAETWAVTDSAVSAPNAFTIEVWFRTTDTGGGRLFGFGSDRNAASTHRDRHLYIDSSGRLRFGVEGSGTQFKFTVGSSAAVTDGDWHHAVATFQPRSMTLWLDGVQQGTRADAASLRQYDGHWRAGRQTLAGWPDAGDYAYTGDVDTVRVHAAVLDAATIAAHHAAGR